MRSHPQSCTVAGRAVVRERSGRGGRVRSRKLPVLRGDTPHTAVPHASLAIPVRHATAASPSLRSVGTRLVTGMGLGGRPRWRSHIPFLSAPSPPPHAGGHLGRSHRRSYTLVLPPRK